MHPASTHLLCRTPLPTYNKPIIVNDLISCISAVKMIISVNCLATIASSVATYSELANVVCYSTRFDPVGGAGGPALKIARARMPL